MITNFGMKTFSRKQETIITFEAIYAEQYSYMETSIIISQIFVLAVVILIGALAGKFRVLTSESKDMLSKVIFNISLPLMLFTNFLKLDATPQLLSNSMVVLFSAVFVILFMLLIGWIATRIFNIKGGEGKGRKKQSIDQLISNNKTSEVK
jgi:hypothetical protein